MTNALDAAFRAAQAALGSAHHAAAVRRIAELAGAAVQRGELARAERALRDAVARAPRETALVVRLAGVLQLAGRTADALPLALEVLDAAPDDRFAAGIALEALNDAARPSLAIAIGERALSARRATPADAPLLRGLSAAYLAAGRASDAVAAARAAWQAQPAHAAAVGTLLMATLYDDTLAPDAVGALHRDAAARIPPVAAPMAPRARRDGRRLRVGVVSADLRNHPMGRFAEPLLAHLDRERFDVVAYSGATAHDAVSAALQRLRVAWHDVARDDDASLHARIQRDAIDVLVDLNGHTHGGRPALFAGRAAPVQVAWLGYPFASGLAGVDALVADDAVVPAGSEALYAEPVARLPHAFLCLPPEPHAPAVAARDPASAFVFGSFNHLAKLSERTVALWSAVLGAVPGSRLALCAVALGDAGTRDATLARFVRHGVAPERVDLLAPRADLAGFLALYDGVDVALDPLPFNGGTTTLQAAWQGVPTLTLPGTLLASRMGASIAATAGLDAFVARDAADYVERARAWSTRRAELATLRATLRERLAATALADPVRFAGAFGALLERVEPRA